MDLESMILCEVTQIIKTEASCFPHKQVLIFNTYIHVYLETSRKEPEKGQYLVMWKDGE